MRGRTVIRVDTSELAMSLRRRLDEIPGTGQRGIASREDFHEVHLDEFPRRPEQAQDVLDVVGAWLDEVGHPEVTVEFRWHLQRSDHGKTRAQQPVLYWKYEDGPANAGPSGSSDDVGSAWLQTQDAQGNITSEPINDGQWIRTEAFALAHANRYTISLDG